MAILFNVVVVVGEVVKKLPPTYLYVPFANTAFT